MSGKLTDLDTNSFDDFLKSTQAPIVVDFWAPWCGPCKAMAPILEELAEEMGDGAAICKVNVDENSEIAGRFNVRAIPTLVIFQGGEAKDQVVGLSSKEDLKAKLESM